MMPSAPGPALAVVLSLAPSEQDIAVLAGDLASEPQVTLLWFADCDAGPAVTAIGRGGATVNLIPAAQYLVTALPDFGTQAAVWLEELRRAVSVPADAWWQSRLSEMNFSDHPWFDLLRLGIILDTVDATRPARMAWLCDGVMGTVLSDLCRRRRIVGATAVTARPPSSISIFGRAIVRWGLNALADAYGLAAARRHRFPSVTHADVLVHAGFPNNWQLKRSSARYRFTGDLPDILPDMAYLVQVTRRSMAALRGPRHIKENLHHLRRLTADARVHVAEAHGSAVDWLRVYAAAPLVGLRWWVAWAGLAQRIRWRGVDVRPLLLRQIVEAPLTDWPKARYWRACIARACRALGARSLCVPIFELVEGRAAVAGGRDAGLLVVGMQHGPNGLAHCWRFDRALGGMVAEDVQFAPHRVAVEGDAVAKGLAATGWPKDRIAVIGAPRIDQATPPFEPETAKSVVLVLGEMHNPRLTFEVAARMVRAVPGWQAVLRPHPATMETVQPLIETLVSEDPLHFFPSTGGPLEDELAALRPGVLIAGVTGATVAAARQGWPVIVALSNWIPNFNPLLLAGDDQPWSGTDAGMIADRLLILSKDVRARGNYSARCTRAGHAILAAEGRAAAARLAQVLKF